MPTREQLDAVVPDRPAYFECFDGHSGWANSRALDAAGISDETLDPPDGRIVRDAAGRATGALKERAVELVDRMLPVPGEAEMPDLLERALRRAAELGITSVQDAWGRPEDLRLLRRLASDGRLPLRVRLALDMLPGGTGFVEQLDEFEALRAETARHGTPANRDPEVLPGRRRRGKDGVPARAVSRNRCARRSALG